MPGLELLPQKTAAAPAPAPAPEVKEASAAAEEKASPRASDLDWLAEMGRFMESPAAQHPEFVQKSLEFARSMREARIRAEALAAEQARLEAERQRLAAAVPAPVKIRRATSPPDGAYIQIGSFPNDKVAEEKWHEVVASLEGVIVNPSRSVFIHEFQQYRRVLIGPFGSAGQARTLLSGIQSDYTEAFVIKFPRY